MSREYLSDRTLGWLRHKSVNQMRDTVILKRPANAIFNIDTGNLDAPSEIEIWRGSARIAPSSGPQTMVIGDELIAFQTETVYLPWDAVIPQRDDMIHVVDSRNPNLVARILRVTDTQIGTSYTSRKVSCVQAESSQRGS